MEKGFVQMLSISILEETWRAMRKCHFGNTVKRSSILTVAFVSAVSMEGVDAKSTKIILGTMLLQTETSAVRGTKTLLHKYGLVRKYKQ